MMRFSSRTTWAIGAFVLSLGFFNACTSSEEETGDLSEPVGASGEDAEPASPEPAAPPPVAPAIPENPAEAVAEPVPQAPQSTRTIGGSATRRVMYVKTEGAAVREKADPKSRVISKLNRGDHMLVNIEGEWARTDQGGYISMKNLSDKGIGRAKRAGKWSGGSEGAVRPAKPKAAPASPPPPASAPARTPEMAAPSADSPAGAGVAPDAVEDNAGDPQ